LPHLPPYFTGTSPPLTLVELPLQDDLQQEKFGDSIPRYRINDRTFDFRCFRPVRQGFLVCAPLAHGLV
jgi:hypothetical protein